MKKHINYTSSVSLAELEAAIDEIWELALQEENYAELADVSRAETIDLQVDAARFVGAGAAAIAVLIYFKPTINKIAYDVWEKFVLPKLEERFGSSALEQTSVEETE